MYQIIDTYVRDRHPRIFEENGKLAQTHGEPNFFSYRFIHSHYPPVSINYVIISEKDFILHGDYFHLAVDFFCFWTYLPFMNKNIKNREAAQGSKLSDSQRSMIFDAFDAAAKVINKKTDYIRRFSEPRKGGLGYRCKFWGIRLRNIDTTKLIAKIQKVLPDGYTVEIGSGPYNSSDLIIRTPKMSIESSTPKAAVKPAQVSDTTVNSEDTQTINCSVDVPFEAPQCPPMILKVDSTIVLDSALQVVSKEATNISFSCPTFPATSEELVGTMMLMDRIFGLDIQDLIVAKGKEGLELCVEQAIDIASSLWTPAEAEDEIEMEFEESELAGILDDKLSDIFHCVNWENFITYDINKSGTVTAVVDTHALAGMVANQLADQMQSEMGVR